MSEETTPTKEEMEESGEVLDRIAEEAGITGDAPGEEDQDEKTFTQGDVDRIVSERLERERRKEAEKQRKAEAAARQQALEENEQFKELAEEKANRVAELEAELEDLKPYKDSSERYREVLDSQLEAQKKDLPGYIKDLLEEKDPAEQLRYLSEHGSEFAEKPAGSSPSPRPAEGQTDQQADKEAKEATRLSIASSL